MALVARHQPPEGRPATPPAAAPAPTGGSANVDLDGELEAMDLRGVRALLAGPAGHGAAALVCVKLHRAMEAPLVRAKVAARSPQAALLLDAHHVLGQAAAAAKSANVAELAAATALLAGVVGQLAGLPPALPEGWAAQQLVRLHELAAKAPPDIMLLCRGWLARLPHAAARLAALEHCESVAAVVALLQLHVASVPVLANVPPTSLSHALGALQFLRNWVCDPATVAPAHLRAHAWEGWSRACVLAVAAGTDAMAQWGPWAYATLHWAVGTFQMPTATALLVVCTPAELQQLGTVCVTQRPPAGNADALAALPALELTIAAFPHVAEQLSVPAWCTLLVHLGVRAPSPAVQWQGWGSPAASGQPAAVDAAISVAPGPELAPAAEGIVRPPSAAPELAAPALGTESAVQEEAPAAVAWSDGFSLFGTGAWGGIDLSVPESSEGALEQQMTGVEVALSSGTAEVGSEVQLPAEELDAPLVESVDAGLASTNAAQAAPIALEEAQPLAAVAADAKLVAPAWPSPDAISACVVVHVVADDSAASKAALALAATPLPGTVSSGDEEEARVQVSCWPGAAALAGAVWQRLCGLGSKRRSRRMRAVAV